MKGTIFGLILLLALSAYKFMPEKTVLKEEVMQDKIEKLLSEMTVEEKVGQMTQITMQSISKQPGNLDTVHMIDTAVVREAITKYHIGSFLNVWQMAYSKEHWHDIINLIQDIALNETKVKIPVIYGIDAIHGVTYTLGATLFPQAISMAASRNPELVKKAGEITAIEMRASGIPWNFNPVLGMGREPLWPRFWETFGEDVHLTTVMGRNYVIGQQGDNMGDPDRVATCMKHYLGYSVPKNGQDRTPAWIPERMVRDIFLPPFEEAVNQGCLTVMVNSGEINGIPTHSDSYLLTEVLKKELGFKGFIVSDWEDIERLHTRDMVAATPKEAVKMAVMAGMDMSMVPFDYSFYELLVELVKDGEVPMERIDDAVGRILYVKMKVGLFDNPYPDESMFNKFATKEFTNINKEAAAEVLTLVKNENDLLPLSKDAKVLVTGPNANKLSVLNGGWTITWQGDMEEAYPHEKNTVLEAVQAKIGTDNVIYAANTEDAVKSAGDADVIVACLGEAPYCETPGNINNLALDSKQIELVHKLSGSGKPIVLVMIQGRPRVMNEIVDKSGAILVAMLPGMEGGDAIADVLFGDNNPSGKLPFSYPKYVNGYTTYDYKPIEEFDVNYVTPQWTFGHGLSYTTFKYSDLKLDKSDYSKTDEIKVSVKVKNTGKRAGKEAVEVYLTDLFGTVTRPVKQLKAFDKILLKPGEEKTVYFSLKSDALAFYGRDNKKVIEPGEFKVTVSNLSQSFTVN
ncbi:MAG: glycosyl hydrolase [Melioribacteraceae bacterium]|nr:MAG: glycosyl hydrolase [Melioribacteraceae bacterium]